MSTDVLISFDTTGSMQPCIREVRRKVKDTVERLFDSIEDLRIALVAHGDYCDGPRSYFELNFTTNQERLIEFINTAPNTNGGDSDEFYEYVFQQAQKLDWQADNRKFIFIADALPHGRIYSSGGRVYKLDWQEEVRKLADMNVNIYSVEALGDRNSYSFYEPVANMTNGRKVSLNQFADAVETIIAISYHNDGTKLQDYQEELTKTFRMNRSLAQVFNQLGASKHSTWIPPEASGLIPVAPYRFQVLHVDENTDIKSFVQETGATFRKGKGFYQFTKPEMIQENKEVVLINKKTGDMFSGAEARNFIGLPFGERGKIRPKITELYDVYVQSTSNNRKLMAGTGFLYENES